MAQVASLQNGTHYVVVRPRTVREAPPGSLGAEMRRLRERVGRTIHDVAAELGWSDSKLSRLETALSGVKEADLTRLFELYGVTEAERSRIRELRNPREHHGAVPDVLDRYLQLEQVAHEISLYGASVVPGLLQTPAYAAAVIEATPTPEDELVKERMSRRMARQALLGLRNRPRLNVVIDEAVLHRPIGGESVMRRQMLRLCELSDEPSTTIRLIPFAVGAHPALSGSFSVLDFGADRPAHVYADSLTGGELKNEPTQVSRYRSCFAALLDLALDEQESVHVFTAAAKGRTRD